MSFPEKEEIQNAEAQEPLSDEQMDEVSGGLNPQPLPPGIASHED
jgi:hypothetical protein